MLADENPFAQLPEDEGEDDLNVEGAAFARTGNFRRNPKHSEVPGQSRNTIPSRSVGRKAKQVASGCNLSCNQEFPALPETQKMPGVFTSQSENRPTISSRMQLPTVSRGQTESAFKTQLSLSGTQPPCAPGLPFAGASGTRSGSGLIPFSELVDAILTAFNASESIKSLAKVFIPTVKPFVQQLAANWPILNMIISFDG